MNTTVTKVGSPHKGFWKLSAAPKNLTPIASGAAFCLPVELHHPDANLLHTPTSARVCMRRLASRNETRRH